MQNKGATISNTRRMIGISIISFYIELASRDPKRGKGFESNLSVSTMIKLNT